MAKKYKAIIFDLDGTLLNTIDDITDSLNYALEKHLNVLCTKEECMYFVGSGVDKLVERALVHFGLYNFDNFINVKETYLSDYKNNQNNKTCPYDGIMELLKYLKSNNYLIGVLSNKPDDDTQKVIGNYFGCEYFTEVMGKRPEFMVKPDPISINYMICKLELNKDEVLYCGDSEVDIQTAKNAMIDCVSVTWGFRKKEELIKLNPNYIVDNASEIIDLFEE